MVESSLIVLAGPGLDPRPLDRKTIGVTAEIVQDVKILAVPMVMVGRVCGQIILRIPRQRQQGSIIRYAFSFEAALGIGR